MSELIRNLETLIRDIVEDAIEKALCKAREQQVFYTVEEVAKMLNCSEDNVYRLKREGKIGCYKMGTSLRFSDEQIAEYKEHNRIYSKYERTAIADTHVATH